MAAEDCIAAGAIVEAMVRGAPGMVVSDAAMVCLWAWNGVSADPQTLVASVSESQGGRNLAKVGLAKDIAECVRVDVSSAVPRWNGEAITA
jgi:phosphosulfolactate phosphohydrolase-like enzyme